MYNESLDGINKTMSQISITCCNLKAICINSGKLEATMTCSVGCRRRL